MKNIKTYSTVIAETYNDKSKIIPVLAYEAAEIDAWVILTKSFNTKK